VIPPLPRQKEGRAHHNVVAESDPAFWGGRA